MCIMRTQLLVRTKSMQRYVFYKKNYGLLLDKYRFFEKIVCEIKKIYFSHTNIYNILLLF